MNRSTTGDRLHLGADATGETLNLDIQTLSRHMAVLGSSGSGKTVTCKVICEELALLGVPIIAVDPQGDIVSLALPATLETLLDKGVADAAAKLENYRNNVEVVPWTPASSSGVPLSLNPFQFDFDGKEDEERIRELSFIAQAVSQLLGYDPAKQDGKQVEAFLDLVFNWCYDNEHLLRDFEDLAELLKSMPSDLSKRALDVIPQRDIEAVMRQVNTLTIGARKLLFTHGTPLDIDTLIQGAGTTRVSVIYLNTLSTQEEKAFFVAELAGKIYDWMLANPSDTPQLLFYIDEVAPFLPPVKKPACKEILVTLLKQARKYGVSCLFATQNPGDLDYKSLGQVATLGLGRLSTQQDLAKIKHLVKSLAPERADAIMEKLPAVEAGEILLISPDEFPEPKSLHTRWLLSEHTTLDEEKLERIVTNEMRDQFASRAKDLRRRQTRVLARVQPTRLQRTEAPAPNSGNTESVKTKLIPAPEPTAAELEAKALETRRSARKTEIIADLVPGSPLAEAAKAAMGDESDDGMDTTALAADGERVAESKRRELLEFLSQNAQAYTQQQLAAALGWPKYNVARELREMETLGAVRRARVNRSHVFYSTEYQFHPRLGIVAQLDLAPLTVLEPSAKKVARGLIPSTVLGGRKGDIATTRLRYLPLWRVKFIGKETQGVLWWKKLVDKPESIYFHPTKNTILLLTTGGFKFDDEVESNPVKIRDLDNITYFERGVTTHVDFVEERLKDLHAPEHVQRMFERKFNLKATEIILTFIPIWEFSIQSHDTGKRWTLSIDGITGNTFEY